MMVFSYQEPAMLLDEELLELLGNISKLKRHPSIERRKARK